MAPIENYALIGDTHTAALVSLGGSIDWLCLPRFDSESCLAALLDGERGGCWRIAPGHDVRSVERAYREESLVLETTFEQKLLEAMGARVELPESGCCGLAGSWGYEAGHYEVSMACAERMLLSEARRASPETLVVADGFSCRTQIEHGAGRKALHLAQALRLAQTGSVPEQPRRL